MNDSVKSPHIIADLTVALRSAIKRRYGESADIGNVSVAVLGGSNRTLLFDLHASGKQRRLVFRQETYRSKTSPFLAPNDQFQLLQIAYRHGLPVPEPVFEMDAEDNLGRGFVMACIEGDSLPKVLLNASVYAPARQRFASQTGEILAKLHSIDSGEADFLANTADSVDPLAAQIARYDSYGEYHPAIDIGIRWLETHRPPVSEKSIVHGDYRNGNLILGPEGIRAVLDWECSHLGSAIEDIAWVCLRSWRYGKLDKAVGGMGERSELYRAYQSSGGQPLEPEVVHWWEVFGLLRWAILNIMQASGHISGERRSLAFASCGRNTSMIEYDLLMTINGQYN